MMPDPHSITRVFTVLTRVIWLTIAWATGSMVGQLILYARNSASF